MRLRRAPRSLRFQLTVLGLIAVTIPLLALLSVFVVTSSDEEVSGPATETSVEVIETTSSEQVPPLVPVAALVLAIAGGVGVWFWTRRAVEPMATITDVANEIQAGSLDRRLGITGAPEEVQALADSFDRMLQRLSRSSATQQRLIEDASHELRTPLAALAVNNEVILSNADPSLDDYRASAERGEALIARLQLTIDDLLVGARSRTRNTEQVDNDLMEIVARAVDQHRAVNPEVPVIVRGPRTLRLGIDGPSVQRALVNLVENASRYSPPGVPIEIDVTGSDPTRLSILDHGPGIPGDQIESVFDRYYKGDDAEGAGIGLALVKQVAEAHGGIEVVSPLPGDDHGTQFILMLKAPRNSVA